MNGESVDTESNAEQRKTLLTGGFAQRFLAPEIAEIERDLGDGELTPEALALRELRSVQEQLQALQLAIETLVGEKEEGQT